MRPKRIFEYRGGWGVQKWPFWAYVLYGWPQNQIYDGLEICYLIEKRTVLVCTRKDDETIHVEIYSGEENAIYIV